MTVQAQIEAVYLAIIATFAAFILFFYALTRQPPRTKPTTHVERPGGAAPKHRMEKSERNWLYFLLAIVVLGNLITLAPMIPSATDALWTTSPPVKTIFVEVQNYTFHFPENPITVPVGKLVEFQVISRDVTYGFGVFRHDGTMVFQMTVIPQPYVNRIRWVFDQPGDYDIRSTEYSGPRHPYMHVPDALIVYEEAIP